MTTCDGCEKEMPCVKPTFTPSVGEGQHCHECRYQDYDDCDECYCVELDKAEALELEAALEELRGV